MVAVARPRDGTCWRADLHDRVSRRPPLRRGALPGLPTHTWHHGDEVTGLRARGWVARAVSAGGGDRPRPTPMGTRHGGTGGEPASEVKEEEPPAAKQASSCGAAPYALSPPSRRDEAVQPRTPRGGGRRRPGPGHAAALVARSSMAATPHLRSYAHGSAPVRTCVSPRYWP